MADTIYSDSFFDFLKKGENLKVTICTGVEEEILRIRIF